MIGRQNKRTSKYGKRHFSLSPGTLEFCLLWNFTSVGLPFSKYLAILAKSLPNKIPVKFHSLRKFPQNSILSGSSHKNSICSRLGLDSELAGNPTMCLVHNWMAPYKQKAEILLVSMDDAKSCHEQFPPIFCLLLTRQCHVKHAKWELV